MGAMEKNMETTISGYNGLYRVWGLGTSPWVKSKHCKGLKSGIIHPDP